MCTRDRRRVWHRSENELPAQERDAVLQNDVALAMDKVNSGDNKKEAQKPMEDKNENTDSLQNKDESGNKQTELPGKSGTEDTVGNDG